MKSFLWSKNSFFYETPLWGLVFIYHAKSTIEVLVWYGVVVVLSGIAMKDMVKIVMQYRTQSSETTVSMGLNASNASLPDIQIVINMPIIHLIPTEMELSAIINRLPYTAYIYDYLISAWGTEEKYVPCINSFHVQETMNSSVIGKQNPELNIDEKNSQIAHHDQWLEATKSIRTKLKKLWQEIDMRSIGGPVETPLGMRETRIKDMLASMNNLIHVLSGYESGESNALDMMAILSMFKQNNQTVSVNQTKVNAKQILKSIEGLLLNHLILEVDMGKIYLRDWSSDLAKSTHTLFYGLVGVENVSQLSIDIYSLHMSRILTVWQSIADHITFRENKDIRDHSETQDQEDFYIGYSDCSSAMMDHLRAEFNGLRQEYENDLHASVQSSVGNVQLYPLYKTQILFKTTGQLISKTDNCYSDKGRRQCLDECTTHETQATCSCIPYWLNYLNHRNITICQRPCMLNEEKCSRECDLKIEQACKQSLMRVEKSQELMNIFYFHNDDPINHSEVPIVKLDKPLLSLTFRKTELINHPVYFKQYSMSSDDLVTRLAGVSEFWIGLNVIAFVHMVIFSIRYIRQDGHGTLITPLNSLRLQLKSLKQLKRSGRKKFWFLSGNKFFEKTPLTALGFINQSLAQWERNAWYSVLLLFIGLTFYNIKSALNRYALRETQTSPQMLLQMNHVYMPNFTVILQTSYFDYFQFMWSASFNGFSITVGDYDHELEQPYGDIMYACHDNLSSFEKKFQRIASRQHADLMLDLDSVAKNGFQKVKNETYKHLAQLQNWQDWISTVGNPLSDAVSKYWANKNAKNPDGFTNEINGGSEERIYVELFSALLMLQSLKAGEATDQWALEQNILVRNFTNETLHANVSMDLQYMAMNLYLKRMVGLSVGQFFLEDWFIDASMGIQRFSLPITLPTNTTEITVNIFSTTFARILIGFNSIIEHASHFLENNCSIPCFREDVTESCQQILECRGDGNLAEALLFRQLYYVLVSNVFKHINQAFKVQLQIAGSDLHLAPFKRQLIEMSATGRYISHTQDCYPGSLDQCISKCRSEQALHKCECMPWYLMYATATGGSNTICSQPCILPDTTVCTQSCSEKVKRPCDTTMLRPELTTNTAIKHIEWHNSKAKVNYSLPLSAITIKMKQKWTHPMFVEVYKMSQAQLLSELGALMEMWLGINIFALIHFISYLVFDAR